MNQLSCCVSSCYYSNSVVAEETVILNSILNPVILCIQLEFRGCSSFIFFRHLRWVAILSFSVNPRFLQTVRIIHAYVVVLQKSNLYFGLDMVLLTSKRALRVPLLLLFNGVAEYKICLQILQLSRPRACLNLWLQHILNVIVNDTKCGFIER